MDLLADSPLADRGMFKDWHFERRKYIEMFYEILSRRACYTD